MAPIAAGGLTTSAAVPPLLAVFYLALGVLYMMLGEAVRPQSPPPPHPPTHPPLPTLPKLPDWQAVAMRVINPGQS